MKEIRFTVIPNLPLNRERDVMGGEDWSPGDLWHFPP